MACSRGCCETQIEHYRSVSIAASACPSRDGGRYAKRVNDTEKRWERDFAAVKSLKREGIVPKQVDGTADLLSRASTRTEIETGKVLNKRQKSQLSALTDKDVT